jgi:hypothetical protein
LPADPQTRSSRQPNRLSKVMKNPRRDSTKISARQFVLQPLHERMIYRSPEMMDYAGLRCRNSLLQIVPIAAAAGSGIPRSKNHGLTFLHSMCCSRNLSHATGRPDDPDSEKRLATVVRAFEGRRGK